MYFWSQSQFIIRRWLSKHEFRAKGGHSTNTDLITTHCWAFECWVSTDLGHQVSAWVIQATGKGAGGLPLGSRTSRLTSYHLTIMFSLQVQSHSLGAVVQCCCPRSKAEAPLQSLAPLHWGLTSGREVRFRKGCPCIFSSDNAVCG